jgi:hypothetical protein
MLRQIAIATVGALSLYTAGWPPSPPGPTTARPVAAATAGCTWESCDGKDPAAMNCTADRAELYEKDDVGPAALNIALYASNACHAAWGEAVDGATPVKADMVLQLWYEAPFGAPEQMLSLVLGDDQNPTHDFVKDSPMVSWNYSVKACYSDDQMGLTVDPEPDAPEYFPFNHRGPAGLGQQDWCTSWL